MNILVAKITRDLSMNIAFQIWNQGSGARFASDISATATI